MKKAILLFVLAIIMVQVTFSQSNPIPKIKFEQAEEAYANDDYRTTLSKLEEVEKLLGSSNPKILYLKIVSQNKIIKQDSLLDFSILEQAKKNCDYYLKNYEHLPNIEEKYRDVFLISEDLKNNYPQSEEEWKRKKEAEEELVFQDALNDNNSTKMEKYLNNYPDTRKKNQAIDFLLTNYLREAEESINRKEHDQTQILFNKIKSFSSSMNDSVFSDNYYALVELEAKNLTEGEKSKRKKYINSAISYYEELNSGTNKSYKIEIQSLKSQEKEWNRKDVEYLIFKTGKEFNDIGLEYGSIPNNGVGFSLTLVLAKQQFLDPAEQETFETELTYSRSYFNVNLTKKIIHPLSVYLGLGYSSYEPIWRDSTDPNMGYIPYNSEPIETITLESGFTFCIRPFAFSIGASFPYLNDEQKIILGMYPDNKLDVNFGIGFTFK